VSREQRLARRARQQVAGRGVTHGLREASANLPMAARVKLAQMPEGQNAAAGSDGETVYSQGGIDGRTLAHELGHNLDAQSLTDDDRRRLAVVMGRPNDPWDVPDRRGAGAADRSSLSERFASLYAMLAVGAYPRAGRSIGDGYLDEDPPSRRELLRFGRSMMRFGARSGLQDYRDPR
jgi:hypothetical protein